MARLVSWLHLYARIQELPQQFAAQRFRSKFSVKLENYFEILIDVVFINFSTEDIGSFTHIGKRKKMIW